MVLDHARLLSILFYVVLLVVSILVMRSCRRKLEYIGWLTVAIHGLLFYAVRGFDTLDGVYDTNFYNFWSTALRIHTLGVAISTLGGIWWFNTRGQKHGC